MDYQCLNPSPQHAPFLEEIVRLPDFNNLHLHLPGMRSWYEQIYASRVAREGEANIPEDTKLLPSFWRAIDDYIAETGFDVQAFEQQRKQGIVNKSIHDRAELMLGPLYIHLRAKGFSQKRIIQ